MLRITPPRLPPQTFFGNTHAASRGAKNVVAIVAELLEEAFAAEVVECDPAKVGGILDYGVDGPFGNILEDLYYEARKLSKPWAEIRWWYDSSVAHTERDQFSVTVRARGRLVLPAALRERLGIGEGDKLVLTVQPDGCVKLVSVRDAVRRARGLFAHVAPPGVSLVDELIAERREEARWEDEGL